MATEDAGSTAATAEEWFPDDVGRIAERTGLTREEVLAAMERLRAAGRIR